jgi:phosphonate transport system substrate-binding protein
MRVTTTRTGLLRIILMLAACLPTLALAQKPDVIEFGIIPTLSARTILTTYQPLREYLEAQFKKPVLFVTAPDFRSFIERTQRGEYRYVITAPHFARLAQKEAGYQPLVRVKRELQAILVVDKSAGINDIKSLRGKVITTPDSLAIIAILGEELLRDRGLVPGRDVVMRAQVSFNSAVIALRNGESAAAITAATALNQMPSEVRESLTALATTKAVSHVVSLANSQVPPDEAAMMARLLTEFSKVPAGKEFFQATGFIDFVRVSDEELRVLDAYVADLKKQLGAP